MCFFPSHQDQPAPNPGAPANPIADNLVLGSSGLVARNADLLGKLALRTPNADLQLGTTQRSGSADANGGQATGNTTATSPGGTMGLPGQQIGSPPGNSGVGRA